MSGTLILNPLLPLPLLAGIGVLALVLVVVALWRGLAGWPWRGLAALVLLAALANPSLQEEDRKPLSDIVIAVVDETSSQSVGDRGVQVQSALAALRAEVAAEPNAELREVTVRDAPGDAGSPVMATLAEAIAAEPRDRIAGAVILSDGQAHDTALTPDSPAPVHLLLTGRDRDWDRRLIVKNAPAFAILGEPVMLTLRVEDQGDVPPGLAGVADLSIAVDGAEPEWYSVPVGEDLELPVTLSHGGQNVLQFEVAEAEGELTTRNNASVTAINGVRDRLRVLLVSGEPHAGERVWRNLLKSDPSVDLVHFTILRPPEKQDGIPVDELSLIAFPTRELFVEKIDEFDLIIFDRYRLRGILPTQYLENVRDYVFNGGTVLVAAGPEFGTADSLWRSPLADILPVTTTSRVLEGGFRPALTDLGQRHPVTQGLEKQAPEGGWGRWFRQIEIAARGQGQVVMQGLEDKPLLVLSREGKGRVAVLASDHAWLWGRGYEGGGPQLELLRRLAHWMLKEPDLEEETLSAIPEDQALRITRRTLASVPPKAVEITAPDGTVTQLQLAERGPGLYSATIPAPLVGLYRLKQDDLATVVAMGPPAPREFETTLASAAPLGDYIAATGGGTLRIEDGLPDLRAVGIGRTAAGRGWIGITPREAYVAQDVRVAEILPAWAWLLIATALVLTGWLREGRMGQRRA
ncbi:glutamine amidotransferase [Gemmobacter serpentinus]|uniref:glutamine amidotransferase n=1 Tax=Gemmobacter serpentinus TaxID=2652247 RepID=UPI00124D890D|nr:glutamine amidotransferase [Gemmobacter serpentinus]